MAITHAKVSAKSDPADTSLVRPSDWNEDHVVVIGADEVAFTPVGAIAATDVQAAIEEVMAEAGGGGGAPTTADYLVATAQAGLSAEIVVGAAPGGELGGSWAAPTVDPTHSGSTHAAAQAAAEATAAAALTAHVADTNDAHDASAVSVVDAGGYFTGTDVEAALQELGLGGGGTTGPVVYVPPGGAATDIQDAIDALPTQGGIIQLGSIALGTYSPASISLANRENIIIQGVGGLTGGADSNTVIHFTAAGSTTKIDIANSTGCGFRDLEIKYTNTGFTGALISSAASTGQCSGFHLVNVLLWGDHSVGQTAVLLDLNRSIIGTFNRVFFNGGGIAVMGRRSVAISSVSVANPSVITATAHGYLTGESVQIGGTSTTPATAMNPPTIGEFVITVTGANTFTIPYNVTAVATGTGYASSSADFCNVQTFRDCMFIQQRIVPVRNVGEAFQFMNCTVQALASGDIGFIDHLPGCRAKGLNIIGGGNYDQTTTTACTVVTFAGTGLFISGFKGSGRQVSQTTFLKIDESGCSGIVAVGNAFDNMYIGLDLGTTINTSGQFGPNGYNNVLAGWKAVLSTAVRKGIEYMDTAASVGRPIMFVWDDNISGSTWQLDGDPLARWYRLGAGLLYTPSELRTGGDIRTAYSLAVTTRVYGNASTAGLAAEGTNADIPLTYTPKGTGRNILNSGLSLPTVISPTQLVANTDNWAPTGLESAATIRINVDAARNITGIVAQPAGCLIRLFNTTAFDITLVHDATSTAANRFLCPGAANFTLRQKGSVLIVYSTTDSRWQVVAP